MCGDTTARTAAPPRGLLDDSPQRLARQRPSEPVDEECARVGTLDELGTRELEVLAQPAKRLGPDWDHPLAASLPGRHDVPGREIHVLDAKAERFGRAQPGCVEQLEQRAIAQPVRPRDIGGLDDRHRVLHREHARQATRGFRAVQVFGWIARHVARFEQMTIETPDGGEMARDAAVAETTRPEPAEIPGEVAGAR